MISLGFDAAIGVVGAFAIAAAAWGANLSVRSAANGPAWAMAHLSRMRRVWPIFVGFAVVMMFVLSPLWIGLSLVYTGATMWFLSASLRRNLARLDALDGFVDIGVGRRSEILKRARRFLIGGGGVIAALGVGAVSFGVVAWIMVALGAVLIATALLLESGPSARA